MTEGPKDRRISSREKDESRPRAALDVTSSQNALAALPGPTLGRLVVLGELYAASNRLGALPPQLGRLRELRVLDVANNALASLPRALGRLTSLQELRASCNRLGAIPPELGKCGALAREDGRGRLAAGGSLSRSVCPCAWGASRRTVLARAGLSFEAGSWSRTLALASRTNLSCWLPLVASCRMSMRIVKPTLKC